MILSPEIILTSPRDKIQPKVKKIVTRNNDILSPKNNTFTNKSLKSLKTQKSLKSIKGVKIEGIKIKRKITITSAPVEEAKLKINNIKSPSMNKEIEVMQQKI
jgi:hypothetical protein